ncbi:mycofactocin-coupled SDR family oxidoreductase [Janibacter melonis]|uniref:mycofactocin-coupled SDR family oxidoreductase n=1 Tax=Janibacter melonis TaxID=262209 RepID=UPI0017491C68|nr:mycofactocin-coupled SDR family oxidoreductase [Janibacter melonis]
MTGRLEGKVAFITGVAKGQGRNHAIRLAREGAAIIGVDTCKSVDTVPYEGSTPADLDSLAQEIEQAGGQVLVREADVRDLPALQGAVADGVKQFGRLDIVLANAGIVSYGELVDLDEETWQTMIDVNLTGVWKTIRAAAPEVIKSGNGGAIVLTSSTAGLKALHTLGHYVAAKHGVIGLARNLANELAPHRIRVNAVAPTNVDTVMLKNPGVYKMFRPDLDAPSAEDAHSGFVEHHLIKEPWIEKDDVSDAILYLVSDTGRYITGTTLSIDLGLGAK